MSLVFRPRKTPELGVDSVVDSVVESADSVDYNSVDSVLIGLALRWCSICWPASVSRDKHHVVLALA